VTSQQPGVGKMRDVGKNRPESSPSFETGSRNRRLRDLYLEGDIDGTEYRTRKAALIAELAALPSSDTPASGVGQRLAAYLADIALAWQVATPEERNELARQMFNSVKIENRTAVEITPRPDLVPFFAALAAESSNVMTYGRKRRGSNPHLQNLSRGHHRVPIQDFRLCPAVVPRWSSRREVSLFPRYHARARKLTPDQEASIRALAGTKSLRALAAQFGVSHETIRAVVQQ
jgi:hypothetical protein